MARRITTVEKDDDKPSISTTKTTKTKIKMRVLYIGTLGRFERGQVYEMDSDKASIFTKSGDAENVDND